VSGLFEETHVVLCACSGRCGVGLCEQARRWAHCVVGRQRNTHSDAHHCWSNATRSHWDCQSYVGAVCVNLVHCADGHLSGVACLLLHSALPICTHKGQACGQFCLALVSVLLALGVTAAGKVQGNNTPKIYSVRKFSSCKISSKIQNLGLKIPLFWGDLWAKLKFLAP